MGHLPRLNTATVWRVSVFEPPPAKHQAPNPRLQRRSKSQNTKPQKQMPGQTARRSAFDLGAWCFFGAWGLEFGACRLGSRPLKNRAAPATLRLPFPDVTFRPPCCPITDTFMTTKPVHTESSFVSDATPPAKSVPLSRAVQAPG